MSRADRSLRILCTTLPSPSHLFPMLPILRGLSDRGHQLVVASSRTFAPVIRACGLTAAEVGFDYLVGDEPRLVPELAAARARGDRSFPYTRIVLAETIAGRSLRDLLDLARRFRPDVVIRDPVDFAGLVAARVCGAPCVTGRENRFLGAAAWQAELGDALDRLGRAAGLAGLGVESLYERLGIAAVAPQFVRAARVLPDPREFGADIADTMRFVQPRAADEPADPDGTDLGSPDVVVTFGTVFNDQPRLLDAVLTAAGRTAHRFLVTVGTGAAPPEVRIPPNVTLTHYAPLSRYVPRCSAVMTLGGTGTVLTTLMAGRPLVLLPVNADQPTNAARCEALGVGIGLPAAQADPGMLTAALDRVLSDAAYTAAAQSFAGRLRALPPPQDAVGWIEDVAGGRR